MCLLPTHRTGGYRHNVGSALTSFCIGLQDVELEVVWVGEGVGGGGGVGGGVPLPLPLPHSKND